MKPVIPCLVSFLLTAAVMPFVIRIATACRCLDAPGGRRLHSKTTPRWGGVAFFVGVLPFLFMENDTGALTPYIVASFLLVGMGAIDDLASLGWKTKFAGMTAAATIVIFCGDLTIHHVGTYGPLGLVALGWLSTPFTYLSVIGITNAINLLDGLNGLAGGVSLLGFLFMGITALLTGNMPVAVVCFAFAGALGAFLLYNFPNARIFMGDSGSLFLGFSLSFTAVLLTQDAKSPVDCLFPVLVLLIPIFDTLRVLFVRLMNGRNPFQADTLHLHYLMVRKNISPVNVTLLFWTLTALFGGIALFLTNRASTSYLGFVLSASAFLGLLSASLAPVQPSRVEGHQTSMETDSAGFSHYTNPNPGLAHKGETTMTFKWIVVLGVVLLSAQMVAGEAPALKTPIEKQSYGLGVDMGRNLRRQGAEMDPGMVLKGMKDAMGGEKLLMSDEELVATMKNFAAERKARQQKDKQATAQEDQTRIENLETIYAIGLVLYRDLADFNLTRGELELVKQGLTHAATGKGPTGDLSAYAGKINELAVERRKALGQKLAGQNKEFLEKSAGEKGALKTDSGLVYRSIKDGSGPSPSPTATVKVNYRGTLPDGKEFDSSYKRGEPLELKMDGVIKCWNEGLQRMKPGGKAELVCPPEIAYGEKGAGNLILPYATLVFEVELLEVKQ
ncbi:peptidylprolyl isomerase [Oryzomonas sagensis]|uniref:peptidylprolyl isomerase n=1 Tax=Oryzomonas sagensis TaxID=2603857 RepID=A0ABQ6TP55_9BACT|nr:FKBP-type peptidyl-prolyl cis-trans isomerase [Oryzomonas sagensis]KAB0670438.1 peptidylprolyl isomerase [Oryzomonas sagensis]